MPISFSLQNSHLCLYLCNFLFTSLEVSRISELVVAMENNYFFNSLIFSNYFILVKSYNLEFDLGT